jgi:hypothetical protein
VVPTHPCCQQAAIPPKKGTKRKADSPFENDAAPLDAKELELLKDMVEFKDHPDMQGDVQVPTSPTANNRALTRQYAMYLKSDGSSEDAEDKYTIKKMLDKLHKRYPALDFPQYEESLRALGISYLITADMFGTAFYIHKVKMADGVAQLFKLSVSIELKNIVRGGGERREKGKKARV